jgi:hypothetical protein
MFDGSRCKAMRFGQHESPAANIEEVMWRWEREAPRPRHHEVEQPYAGEQARAEGTYLSPHRLVVARWLVALAGRIAPRENIGTVAPVR